MKPFTKLQNTKRDKYRDGYIRNRENSYYTHFYHSNCLQTTSIKPWDVNKYNWQSPNCGQGGSVVKNPPNNAGDTGDACSIPGWGRSHRVRNSNSLQYSSLGNSMDRGGWQSQESDAMEHPLESFDNSICIPLRRTYKKTILKTQIITIVCSLI